MAKTKTSTKKTETISKSTTSEDEVAICRRRGERRAEDETAEATELTDGDGEETDVEAGEGAEDGKKLPERRKKVQRRRQIDPTTCERDYTNDEIEFMHALDAYKRANGRMFPTCSEILEVVRSIGYEKIDRMEIVEEVIEVGAEGEVEPTDETVVLAAPIQPGTLSSPEQDPLANSANLGEF